MPIIYADNNNFHDVMQDKTKKKLVVFGATWCGHCRRIEKELNKIEPSLLGKVDIIKIDMDSSDELAKNFGVKGIPATFLFENGQLKNSHIGYMTELELLSFSK